MISHDLEVSLNLAVSEAARRGHEYVTVEHVLYALLHNNSAANALRACGGDIPYTRKNLDSFFDEKLEKNVLPEGELPQPTLGFQRIIQRAVQNVRSAGREEVNGANLLVSIYGEKESHAAYFLHDQDISRFDIVNFVSHGIVKEGVEIDEDDGLLPPVSPVPGDDVPIDDQDEQAQPQKSDPLAKYAVDLCARARQGDIDPLIGRDLEIERTIQILTRRRKNNPLLVGDAGVGKTAIAEGLALRIVDGDVPEFLKHASIYSLDMGTLLAGSKFRGDFEQRLKGVMKAIAKKDRGILFIDEIHTVIGAGSVSGGAMDASNLLKPALSAGELRCIGSTTFKEFRNTFEADHALARRFQKVDIEEPTVADTVKILKGLKSRYEEHHGVRYSNEAIRAAVELSARYITDRKLPDKAIDVIDEVGAATSIKATKRKTISVDQVQAIVAKMAKIPPQKVSTSDRESLKHLEGKLKKVVFGQNKAVEETVTAIKVSRSGLGADDKPIGSFLFAGPTGVGKTELAKQLAKIMGIEFLRYDMSEYMEKHSVSRLIGAPPGYVGFDQGGLLTEAITKTPHCVLLLDEIEKAHPDLQNILLQVFDHGSLTDPNGRKADFRNVIIIMTTNAGARELTTGAIGFDRKPGEQEGISEALKEQFSPEFRNRLDAIVNFSPLSQDIVLRIVDKFIAEISERLNTKNVSIELTKKAKEWLAERGFDHLYGARPLARLIKEQISRSLSEELLFGKLSKGGRVHVDKGDEGLKVKFL